MTAALNAQPTEHQLVARMARNDRAALQALYEAYFPHLCKLFAHLTVTKDWPVIERLIEDTMMEAWRTRASFDGTGSVYVWIMRMALDRRQPLEAEPDSSSLLKTLSTQERAVVHFVYTGHSRNQTAEILSVKPHDVDELLYQARAKLRPRRH